ncbi:MAG: GAF and ANTAR domain-containing protein [Nocardioidaceae bacterium]|nr:GAF and ANTAR domain-containing protein [Nocardioidaceae bacterium]
MSDDDRSPADHLAALQTLLMSMEGIDSFLQQTADLASRAVEPPVSCGITSRHGRQPVTVSSSDGLAARLDERQYEVDGGPCLQAMATGEVVDVSDVGSEGRWPDYIGPARTMGVRSSLSMPLLVAGVSVGAVNLYDQRSPHAFDGVVRRDALAFVAQASTALALALRQWRSDEQAAQLEQALVSRSVIDQALGIVMSQQRCDAETAFAILRAHSQNNNVKLRDVAARLVARTSSGPAVPGPSSAGRSEPGPG